MVLASPVDVALLLTMCAGNANAGPVADALNLNAGYALAAAQVAATPQDGIRMAQEAQQSGRAGDVLRTWAATSQALAQQEQNVQQLAAAAS